MLGGKRLLIAALLLAVVGGALALLASPRHRAFYLGWLWSEETDVVRRVPSADASSTSTTSASVRTVDQKSPGPATQDPLEIVLAERIPARLPVPGVPRGWETKEFAGRADVELVRDDRVALRLRSERSSFALYRSVIVDLRERPILSWSWKVTRLPAGGDARAAGTDDQAAQLYVVFPRWPNPQGASEVIGYVWDTSAPRDTTFPSRKAANVRLIVVESGASRLGSWQTFRRNVARDYFALFGQEAPRVGKIALMIDSNDTRSEAETLVADLVFSGAGGKGGETPTSMLR